MRSRLGLVLFLALIASLAIITPARADTAVTIPDANFKQCIAEALGVDEADPITDVQMATIPVLDCAGRGIVDMTGWQHLVNVEVLDLWNNELTTAAIPASLTNLDTLYLSDNQLTSVTVPGALTNLATLDLNNNKLTSITLPGTLTNMSTLHLAGNMLASVALPATLTNLEWVELQDNRLTSITIPATLVNLFLLDLGTNKLTSITIPSTLVNLGALNLGGNQLTGIVLPGTLTDLGWLELQDNQLTSVTIPATLTSLEGVFLDGNKLADLSGLAWLPDWVVDAFDQDLTLPDVAAGAPFTLPIRDHRGQPVTVTPAPGVTVTGNTVTYAAAGTFTLDFVGSDGYSGTITHKATPSTPTGNSGVFGDHTGDGIGDLFAVDASGQLRFYQGSKTGAATYQGVRGTGWGSMTYLAQIDDITGDKRSDLLARRGTDNSLWVYRGLGGGAVTGWKQVGKNWGGMDQIVPVGNLAGGSTQYVVARRAVDGALFRYTLTPNGLTDIKHIGQNWQGMTQILSVGDFNGDGRSDILAIRNDGLLWSYLGTASGGIGAGRQVGHGWSTFTRAFSAGDLSGDGVRDLVGQRADGAVFTYQNKMGSWGVARQIMTGTQTFMLMA